jgi:hypothetical protein
MRRNAAGARVCPRMRIVPTSGGGVVSVRVMILKGFVDRLDVDRLGRCRRECSERRERKSRIRRGPSLPALNCEIEITMAPAGNPNLFGCRGKKARFCL